VTTRDRTDKDFDRLVLFLRSETELAGELDKRGDPSDERRIREHGRGRRMSTDLPRFDASPAFSVAGNDN
jgi:hypothetical protein